MWASSHETQRSYAEQISTNCHVDGGVTAEGQRRIQIEFWFEGVRYRPLCCELPLYLVI